MGRSSQRVDVWAMLGLLGALALCLAFWTGVGVAIAWQLGAFKSSTTCTSGASSIALGHAPVTDYHPEGCRHG